MSFSPKSAQRPPSAWAPNQQHGWPREAEAAQPASFIRSVIHTILEIIPGGVIRAGKTTYDDDLHAGFWLGVGADRIARFNLGGATHALRWTGESLEITGWFATPTVTIDGDGLAIIQGDDISNQLRFVDAIDHTLGALEVTGDWGPWLILETTQPLAAGDTGRLDLAVDGDLGANVILRLETTRSAGPASSVAKLMIGNLTKFRVDAAGLAQAMGGFDASHHRVRFVADAEQDTDALNRRAADARYLPRDGGWSGQLALGGVTLTIADGRIVAVA